MEIIVRHEARVLIGDYPFSDSLNKEVLSLLESGSYENIGHTNVKGSIHTEWHWGPDNIKFRNLQGYVQEEIERAFKPGMMRTNRDPLRLHNFWGNVYEKGDYADSHDHKPNHYSFAYFIKAKWYHAPLVFTDSGKKVRPKEGRFVAFPAFLNHHVPKHRYNSRRITLSGNFRVRFSS